MDHAEAHERIADLALEPRDLETLLASESPDDRALAEHAAGCDTCRAELDAWQGVHRTLVGALRTDRPGARIDVEPIEPDDALRAGILAAARADRSSQRATPARISPVAIANSRIWSPLLGLAAALVVAVAGTFLLAGPGASLLHTVDEARALSGVVASVNRILAEPNHEVAQLKTTAGQSGGSVAWASRDLVVLTSALTIPGQGQTYRCWLASGGVETAIGRMEFAGTTAYWVGSLDDWASISLEPGTRFIVSLEPTDGLATRTGAVVLEADL
ncbi:MAG TPA: anti-sigma factor [Candidatus Limnocylindrales bacterium]|nr:anti-sigma factor [Candidatus Limnocylindrales bacterium]